MESDHTLKQSVKSFWEQETCGTRYGESTDKRRFYEETAQARYKLEPLIPKFAEFDSTPVGRMLELGVGGGADFHCWIKSGHKPIGIDLTEAGIGHTRSRLQAFEVAPERYSLLVGDAEHIPFKNDLFDLVYSWGVLHHSPDTTKCFEQVFRILKPGGNLKAMIYHDPSWTGFLLWVRYALLCGRPRLSQSRVVFDHLESPGTKVYSKSAARRMLDTIGFSDIRLSVRLSPGDTLSIKPSRKYQGFLYSLIWKFYPRALVRLIGDKFGLFLLINARKPIS